MLRGCEVGGATQGFILVKLISNSKLDLSPELQTVSTVCLCYSNGASTREHLSL